MKLRVVSDGRRSRVETETGELIEGVTRADWTAAVHEIPVLHLEIHGVEFHHGVPKSEVEAAKQRLRDAIADLSP